MSDLPADGADRLDLREQIARIDRSLDEAAKFRAERTKLETEARKLNRERFLSPLLATVATLGAIAAVGPFLLRAWMGQ